MVRPMLERFGSLAACTPIRWLAKFLGPCSIMRRTSSRARAWRPARRRERRHSSPNSQISRSAPELLQSCPRPLALLSHRLPETGESMGASLRPLLRPARRPYAGASNAARGPGGWTSACPSAHHLRGAGSGGPGFCLPAAGAAEPAATC